MLGEDQQTINQELYGMVGSSTDYLLQEYVPRFISKHDTSLYHGYVFKDSVQVGHSYIDPSGGGDLSQFSVCSEAREEANFGLLGMATHVSNDRGVNVQEIREMLFKHYLDIWSKPMYSTALMWVYFEAQSSKIDAEIWAKELCDKFNLPGQPPRIFMYHGIKGAPNQPGILVDETEKKAWAITMQELLMLNTLWYAHDMANNNKQGQPTVKLRFEDQMRRYAKSILPAKDQFGKAKVTYGAKAGGQADDIVSAAAAALRNHKERLHLTEYRNWCRTYNIIRT
jgi:hypothetical protein